MTSGNVVFALHHRGEFGKGNFQDEFGQKKTFFPHIDFFPAEFLDIFFSTPKYCVLFFSFSCSKQMPFLRKSANRSRFTKFGTQHSSYGWY